MTETERILRFERTRVEAAEREVSGMEQQLKETRRRLNSNQEKAALASMEEWDALVRRGNAFQDRHPDGNPEGADGWPPAGEGQSIGRPG